MSTATASLVDGTQVDYNTDNPMEGAEKIGYFTTDRQSVVLLFKDANDAKDPERFHRLQSILGKYNPTQKSAKDADHWQKYYCWPSGIIVKPSLGLVAPAYPRSFRFRDGSEPWCRKDKKGKWFSSPKARQLLPPEELGHWLGYLKVSILMARAVRRLHSAGLAHSDLSPNNVLIDPVNNACIIIDIDSLVVPGLHPPKVLGTKDYIAPEVMAGEALPSIRTDLHAMAVLIYELLMLRHPLKGPRTFPAATTDEAYALEMGKHALFIEHQTDRSNRPANLKIPFTILGPYIADMVRKAFVDGLHEPNKRPTALEWERALVRSTDLLLPCGAANCTSKWLVYTPPASTQNAVRPTCAFCGTVYPMSTPVLDLFREAKPGTYHPENHSLVVWKDWPFFRWHVFNNVWPGDFDIDRTRQGYCTYYQGRWFLVNENCDSMSVINGAPVRRGESVELVHGMQVRFSAEPTGRLAAVRMIR